MAKTYVDKRGYKRFRNSGKLVDRWSAEKRVGRPLVSRDVVHHINRNKSDNRPSNLWVFGSQKEHDRTHRRDKKRFGFW